MQGLGFSYIHAFLLLRSNFDLLGIKDFSGRVLGVKFLGFWRHSPQSATLLGRAVSQRTAWQTASVWSTWVLLHSMTHATAEQSGRVVFYSSSPFSWCLRTYGSHKVVVTTYRGFKVFYWVETEWCKQLRYPSSVKILTATRGCSRIQAFLSWACYSLGLRCQHSVYPGYCF